MLAVVDIVAHGTFEQAWSVIEDYESRWRSTEYQKALKSAVEDATTANRIAAGTDGGPDVGRRSTPAATQDARRAPIRREPHGRWFPGCG